MNILGRKEVDLSRGPVPQTAASEMYRQSDSGPGQTQTVDRRVRILYPQSHWMPIK